MKIQSLTFLPALTFLFLFSGFSVVFGGDLKDGVNAYETKDYETAIKLLVPLAKYGDPQAQLLFGKMFQNGQGVPRDHKEAAKWYFLSAEQGHLSSDILSTSIAQYRLGIAYLEGQGVPQDRKEAIKWLLISAELNNLKALGLIRANVQKWHKYIAEKRGSYAHRFLGEVYYLGLGVTKDYTEAAKWYKKAAEKGDNVAQIILGAMYEKGKGIPKDFVEAYKWFSISEMKKAYILSKTSNTSMYKEKLEKQNMTPAQIKKAQKLAREWVEQHQ